MGWSWEQFEDCPQNVADQLLRQIQSDYEKREADEQAREMKRRHQR